MRTRRTTWSAMSPSARGKPDLTVRVVPDSAVGELVGLAGTLTIDIVDGKHFYTFDYTLA